MLAQILLATVLLLAGKAEKAGDPALVGRWGLEGHTFMELKADGTGTMEEDTLTWKSDGSVLIVTSSEGEMDKATYKISGTELAIVVGGIPMKLTRIGGSTAAAHTPESKMTTKIEKSSKLDVNESLSKLLLSSPWCTGSTRMVYGVDGTWSKSQSSSGGAWKIQQNQLFMSSADSGGQLVPVQLNVTRTASGAATLNANGEEFSQCP